MNTKLIPLLLASLALGACTSSPLNSLLASPLGAQSAAQPVSQSYSHRPTAVVPESQAIAAVEQPETTTPNLSQPRTYSNGQWRVQLSSSSNSNSGASASTGAAPSISYRGCDAFGNCVTLDQGSLGCRDRLCEAQWSKGDYLYSVQWIQRETPSQEIARLTIWQGATRLIEVTDLQARSSAS